MIIDLQTAPPGVILEVDLCIVGSGPAGLTLASEFAHTKHQVALLEAGGFGYEAETQALYQGTVASRAYPLSGTRLRQFGGTSGHWEGQCGIYPSRHLEVRSGVTDAHWPISYAQLLPYYRKANHLLELGNFDYEESKAKQALYAEPLPSSPLTSHVWRGRMAGPLHFGPRMRTEIEQAPNIQCFLHANVTKLITNEQANQLVEVQFSTLDGKRGVARARCFVLACGGLEIPRLLLNTDAVLPFGLGNRRDLVGRYFMEHPNATIGALHITDPTAGKTLTSLATPVRDQTPPVGFWKPAFCLGEALERAQKVGGGYYRLSSSFPWDKGWATFTSRKPSIFYKLGLLARFFDEWAYVAYRKARRQPIERYQAGTGEALVFIEFEQIPNPDSRVLLTDDTDRLGLRRLSLDWRLSEQDIRTARAMGEAIGREVSLRGWGRFRFDDWLLGDKLESSRNFGISGHHIGTVRMADNPHGGVVDAKCRLFDCDNLYIAGSAVFPTSSFVNPTLTLVALAYRMADDLKERLA